MPRGFLRTLLAIPDRDVTFETRGFQAAPKGQRARLENIGRTFVTGYHNALDYRDAKLEERLAQVDLDDRGFAFEGAAMALAILDAINPFRKRLDSWMAGPARPHEYMTLVGAGWAIARIPWHRVRAERRARAMHPFLWPLAIDGFGFHQGYFHASNLAEVSKPKGLDSDLGRSAYDQGLGRSFWFSCGADPWKIAETMDAYDQRRRRDLWSGAGLACAYAGGVSADEVRVFTRLAGAFAPAAGQGACFAAKARLRAGNPAAHTDMACRILCGISASEAAQLSDQTYAVTADLNGDYRDWCRFLQSRLEAVGTPAKVRNR